MRRKRKQPPCYHLRQQMKGGCPQRLYPQYTSRLLRTQALNLRNCRCRNVERQASHLCPTNAACWGMPPSPPALPRSTASEEGGIDVRQIHLWLTDKERAALNKLAEQSGLTLSAVVRKLISSHEIKQRPPTEWPELVRQISAIGNNINQIVRIANSQRTTNAETIKEIMRLQAAIWEKLKSI